MTLQAERMEIYVKATQTAAKVAQMTSSLIGRKCRASHIKVLEFIGCDLIEVKGWRDSSFKYTLGEIAEADSFDDDIRVECTNGIHFFMTREEAEQW